MMLGLFVVTLLHAEGVGRWGEWNCPKNSSTRRNSEGQLYMARKQNHDVKDFFPPHSVRLTMVIGSLHLRLLRMGKTKETIRIYPPILLCFE
jgi:hypothetical protein